MTTDLTVAPGEHFLFTGEPSPVVQNLLHFSGAVWINRNQRHHPYGYGFCWSVQSLWLNTRLNHGNKQKRNRAQNTVPTLLPFLRPWGLHNVAGATVTLSHKIMAVFMVLTVFLCHFVHYEQGRFEILGVTPLPLPTHTTPTTPQKCFPPKETTS